MSTAFECLVDLALVEKDLHQGLHVSIHGHMCTPRREEWDWWLNLFDKSLWHWQLTCHEVWVRSAEREQENARTTVLAFIVCLKCWKSQAVIDQLQSSTDLHDGHQKAPHLFGIHKIHRSCGLHHGGWKHLEAVRKRLQTLQPSSPVQLQTRPGSCEGTQGQHSSVQHLKLSLAEQHQD